MSIERFLLLFQVNHHVSTEHGKNLIFKGELNEKVI